jgi:hypothetical protein
MSNSSPHTICWTGSTDTSTITLNDTSTSTITLTGTDGSTCHTFNYGNACYPISYQSTSGAISGYSGLTSAQISTLSNISISNGGTGSTCYTIGNGINSGFRINLPEEFVNCFPDFDRIQKMCEEYPGLKIAYEKFITTYKLVKNHYDTPEDERPRP